MKRCVRAIITYEDNILVMRRDKFGQQYYILIGGHVGVGESLEKALFREIHEETMIRMTDPKLVYVEHAPLPYGDQYIYTCEYVSGVPMLHPDADERYINHSGDNVYTPMWLPIAQLETVPFRSPELRSKIIKGLAQGFPKEPKEYTPKS